MATRPPPIIHAQSFTNDPANSPTDQQLQHQKIAKVDGLTTCGDGPLLPITDQKENLSGMTCSNGIQPPFLSIAWRPNYRKINRGQPPAHNPLLVGTKPSSVSCSCAPSLPFTPTCVSLSKVCRVLTVQFPILIPDRQMRINALLSPLDTSADDNRITCDMRQEMRKVSCCACKRRPQSDGTIPTSYNSNRGWDGRRMCCQAGLLEPKRSLPFRPHLGR